MGTQCQPAAPTQVPAAPRGPAGRARSLSVRQHELCSPCAPSCPPTSHRGQTCLLVQAVPCKLRHPSWASSPSNLWWVDHILTPASGRSELAQAVAGPSLKPPTETGLGDQITQCSRHLACGPAHSGHQEVSVEGTNKVINQPKWRK